MVSVTPWSRGRIIVFGILFWYPLAGVTYQFLHYLLGLRSLGYDVWYVEDSARYVYDPRINDLNPDASANVTAVRPILERFGFGDRWAFRGAYDGGEFYGLTEHALRQLYASADAFLNVTGAQELRDEHLRIPRRIYVESDPFRSQVRVAQGDQEMIDLLDGHDMHFTFGENIGQPDCLVPLQRYDWLPTRQPVALELWKDMAPPATGSFRTVTTWHNKGKDIEWQGDRFHWTKDREFQPFLDLPARTGACFELATSVDHQTRQSLVNLGWGVVDAVQISSSTDGYRDYIGGSLGEFTVARDQYVRPRTGWFSDRSACYLAAGRPVVTEETGFSKVLPTGEGLFGFSNVAEAAEAVDRISRDPASAGVAARAIASEYFAAERVLGSLLERAGL